jgi:hypothetical protein
MKTFKDYLTESKKIYNFKIKVAGDVPENFQEDLKTRLECCKVLTFEKMSTTPIQKLPLDFPNKENMEVTIYEVICEYPITTPEISTFVKDTGVLEDCFRVRGAGEPSEIEQLSVDNEPSGEALLNDPCYKETTNPKHKDYFGDDFNKSFLKDLSKTAKQQKKDNGQGEYKMPKVKTDKIGAKSAIGS